MPLVLDPVTGELLNRIDGTDDRDTLQGSDGSDLIEAYGGNDLVIGNGGNDHLRGGSGHDDLRGGVGDDRIYGGEGDDRIQGGAGNNVLSGGTGDDWLVSSGDDEFLYFLNEDTDIIVNSGATDVLSFGAGITEDMITFERVSHMGRPVNYFLKLNENDGVVLFGESTSRIELGTIRFSDGTALNAQELFSQKYAKFSGTDGDDDIQTFDRSDEIHAMGGSDHIRSGAGSDYINKQGGDAVIHAGQGRDYVHLTNVSFAQVYGGEGDDELVVKDLGAGQVRFFGDEGNDLLVGGQFDDHLVGGQGGDSIHGNGGDDLIRGDLNNKTGQDGQGGGDDFIYAGAGNDRVGGKGGDDYIYGDRGNDKLWGDEGDDIIYGGLDTDFLSGQAGNDYLDGGVGSPYWKNYSAPDRLLGGSGDDTLVYDAQNHLIDGGADFDTLLIKSGTEDVDLRGVGFIKNIEKIDLANRDADTLTLRESDVLRMLDDSTDTLLLKADGGDVLDIGVSEGEFSQSHIVDGTTFYANATNDLFLGVSYEGAVNVI